MDIERQTKPEGLRVNFDNIAESLKELPQWIVWKYSLNNEGKWKKPPFSPTTGRSADINNSLTWGSFEDAYNAYSTGKYSGIGFVLTEGSGITGIDIDHCIKDGAIHPKASWLIETIASYTEISPSGGGIRIFVKANIPNKFNRYKRVEMYQKGRYLTVTGHKIEGTPIDITSNQTGLETAYSRVFQKLIEQDLTREDQQNIRESSFQISPERQGAEYTRVSKRSADEIISFMLKEASNRDDLRRYFEGDKSLWGEKARHSSKSNAVYRFVRHLVYWTDGDRDKIQEIMRKSKLYDEKWERVGDRTIDHALNPQKNS